MTSIHLKTLMLISVVFVLSACAGHSRYNIDMSMTELSNAIEGATETVEVSAQSHFHSNVSSGVWVSSRASGGSAGFANNRFSIGSRTSLDFSSAGYRLGRGIDLAFIGGDDVNQFRGAVFYQPASFLAGTVDGFNSPALLGLDLGLHAILDLEPVEFYTGIRGTSAVLAYQFDTPIKIGYETFSADSLGLFGLGWPVGMHMMLGQFSIDAVVTPTVYLHSYESTLGARNDLVTWTTHTPVTVGIGYHW